MFVDYQRLECVKAGCCVACSSLSSGGDTQCCWETKEPTRIDIGVLCIDVLFLCVYAGEQVRPGGFKILFVNIYIWLAWKNDKHFLWLGSLPHLLKLRSIVDMPQLWKRPLWFYMIILWQINIGMEIPPFWWYLSGKTRMFHGSLPEGTWQVLI